MKGHAGTGSEMGGRVQEQPGLPVASRVASACKYAVPEYVGCEKTKKNKPNQQSAQA